MALIAGPCSVESEEQVIAIAKEVKAAGANMLRGGAFKPRTSPYAFQGLGSTGLDYLVAAKKELFNLRFQNATNQLDNTSRIKEVRRNIARIQTIITEKANAAQ